jgi:hypothetical protein
MGVIFDPLLGRLRTTDAGGGGASPLTTKGDLYGFSTVDARLPVGTNGQALIADSTETLGVKWAAAPAAGAGGSTTEVQFNNAGSLDGLSGFVTDGTSPILTAETYLLSKDSGGVNHRLIGIDASDDIVVGDAVLGANLVLQSSDTTTYLAAIGVNEDNVELKYGVPTNGVEQYFRVDALNTLFTSRYFTEIALPNGITHDYVTISDLVADNDILQTINYKGYNSLSSVVPYARTQAKIINSASGGENGVLTFGVVQDGSIVDRLTLSNQGMSAYVDDGGTSSNYLSMDYGKLIGTVTDGTDYNEWRFSTSISTIDLISAAGTGAYSFAADDFGFQTANAGAVDGVYLHGTPTGLLLQAEKTGVGQTKLNVDPQKITLSRVDNGTTGAIYKMFHDSASPAVNDVVGALQMFGYDSAAVETNYGQILTTATNVTNGAEKAQLGMYTTVNGVSTLAGYFESAQFVANAGSISAPGITFVGAGSNTGFYSTGANSIDVTLAGTRRFQFNSNTIRAAVAGSAAAPTFTTTSDADTGAWVATGVTGFTVDGTEVGQFNVNGLQMGDAKNFVFNTTTGTKLATGTTQKMSFWNATPVVQPAHIADPSGGAIVDAEARTAINAILAWQATLGLTAAA